MIRSKDPSAEQPEECEALHPQSISARIVPISALPDKLASIFGSTASAKPVNDETNFGNGLAASVKPTGLSGKAVRMQLLMSFLANITVLSIGLGMAFPSVSITAMTDSSDDMSMLEHEFSWFASINAIVSPIGGLMVSVLLDRFGRKNTLYLINVFAMSAWILKATASRTNRDYMLVQLMLARVIVGITCGLASSPCSIYTAEISHPSIRGRMSIMTPLGISSGVLFIYAAGCFIPTDWRLLSSVCFLISLVGLLTVYFLPETPSWLIAKGRFAEAEASLKLFRGLSPQDSYLTTECQQELDVMIEKSRVLGNVGNETIVQKLRQPILYRPLLIMFGFFAFQQASGLFVIIVFASKVCKLAGTTIDPFLCAVYLGSTRVVGTIVIGFLMDTLGRRALALFSGCVMGISMIGISIYCGMGYTFSWIPLVLILTYFFAGSLGLMTLPFTMIAEVYPQQYRGLASGLTTCVLFINCFIVTKLFPTMAVVLGGSTLFAVYGTMSLLSVIFVYYLLPETNGKTLAEISDQFCKREKSAQIEENLKMLAKNNLKLDQKIVV